MPDRDDVRWFKSTFGARLAAAVAGTPLTVDFLTAIACQETGEIWPILRRKGLAEAQVLALCVGDTLDADRGRSAFPKNKTALLAEPDGAAMFEVAHDALVAVARHIPAYRGAAAKPNKFCHGFGLFQRDLQFFRDDPQYFLQRRYERFDQTLAQGLRELQRGLRLLGWQDRAVLSDLELAAVGIAYNTGRYRANKGLKQGYFDGSKYYGEALFDFLRLAQSVDVAGAPAVLPAPSPGNAPLPPPADLTATGRVYRVDTRESTLRLRSDPTISEPAGRNVLAELPDGHLVRAVAPALVNGFRQVETRLGTARFEGFAASRYLVAEPGVVSVDEALPVAPTPPPPPAIPPVTMPRKAGTVTLRKQPASAHSLNEPGQPSRHGATPDELRAELAAIVDWLCVDKVSHKRYQPHDGLTFCNIYSHDYCLLAGVYLPRVWWSTKAIAAILGGAAVTPLIGDTIGEMRANDLFRWLHEFGPAYGWRRAESATALQQEANQGAVGLIVARRKQDGRSGHIVLVVPETDDQRARRDTDGNVIAPLQSQAGSSNFRYGTGVQGWWRDERFADSAMWLHA